jgi:hypothetical protein
MRTYGKNKPTSKFGSGTTYTATTADSPEDQKDWGLNFSSVPSKSSRPTALQDRGQASLNDDLNIRTDSKMFSKDKLGGKRARCSLIDVVKGGDWKDLQYLLESILIFNKNPALSGGTLFVTVPVNENAPRLITWLRQLGFKDDYLGDVQGFKYPKDEVTHSLFSLPFFFCIRFSGVIHFLEPFITASLVFSSSIDNSNCVLDNYLILFFMRSISSFLSESIPIFHSFSYLFFYHFTCAQFKLSC